MRVGMVLGDDGRGAPWNYVKTLTTKLATGSDIEPVALYTGDDPDQFPAGTEVVDYSSESLLPAWHTTASSHDLDLFHVNTMPKYGHWPAFRSTVPVVVTSHGAPHWQHQLPPHSRPSKQFNVEFRWRDRVGKLTMDAVFTVSERLRETYIDAAGYSPDRVYASYEAVADEFYTTSRRPAPADLPSEYLLHISNHSYVKNVETIIKSLPALADTHGIDIPLVIAGEGWEENVSELAARLGVAERVVFTGYVPETDRIVQLYDHASCFVFPSFRESFGLPNVEAMARGTPVITSDRYAIPEIVDGGAVLLDDPLDEQALADAINDLLTDEEFAETLATRGREQATRFRWEAHLRTIERLYSQVLEPTR